MPGLARATVFDRTFFPHSLFLSFSRLLGLAYGCGPCHIAFFEPRCQARGSDGDGGPGRIEFPEGDSYIVYGTTRDMDILYKSRSDVKKIFKRQIHKAYKVALSSFCNVPRLRVPGPQAEKC